MPRQSTTNISGRTIDSGFSVSGNGPAVVLLHSSLSAGTQWLALVKKLNPHFLSINIDLLGYGGAPPVSCPDDFQLLSEVERIIAIINHQIGDANFSIIGHSYGGAVGLRLAYELKARVSAMVLYEPVAFHLLDQQSAGYAEIIEVSEPLAGYTSRQGAQRFVDYWNGDGFFGRLPGKVQQLFSDKMAKVLLDFKALITEPCTITDYQFANCPILLMQGQSSRLSAQSLAEALARQLVNVTHHVFAGGHMAPVSDSEAVAEIMAGYLRRQGV
jgi:pimeloyl-ACP methyl ester carboxylesterase